VLEHALTEPLREKRTEPEFEDSANEIAEESSSFSNVQISPDLVNQVHVVARYGRHEILYEKIWMTRNAKI
jgi:hypothetical protein